MINVTGVKLETYRLILRKIDENDLADFNEYASVEGVGEAAGWQHHSSIAECELILKKMVESCSEFAVVYKKNNKMIGTIGIQKPTVELDGLNGVELGYVISKDYWGMGIATEAIREVIRWLMFEVNVDYVSSGHFVENERSKRVIVKNKLKFVKDLVYTTRTNEKKNSKYYVLKREDYLKTKEIVQRFDPDGNRLEIKTYRGEKHIPNTYVGVVDIIIKNVKYDLYLVTKRDINKETYPGFFEISGGAIDYGEDLEHAAIREVKEETGLDIFNLKYRYKTFGNHMLYFTFTAETNNELNAVRLQAGETMDYKWIKANEFKELFDSDKVPDKQRFRLKKAIEEFVK